MLKRIVIFLYTSISPSLFTCPKTRLSCKYCLICIDLRNLQCAKIFIMKQCQVVINLKHIIRDVNKCFSPVNRRCVPLSDVLRHLYAATMPQTVGRVTLDLYQSFYQPEGSNPTLQEKVPVPKRRSNFIPASRSNLFHSHRSHLSRRLMGLAAL